MGSQALPSGLWYDQHVMCCGQQGAGAEVAAALKTPVAGRPESVSPATWRRSRFTAEGRVILESSMKTLPTGGTEKNHFD